MFNERIVAKMNTLYSDENIPNESNASVIIPANFFSLNSGSQLRSASLPGFVIFDKCSQKSFGEEKEWWYPLFNRYSIKFELSSRTWGWCCLSSSYSRYKLCDNDWIFATMVLKVGKLGWLPLKHSSRITAFHSSFSVSPFPESLFYERLSLDYVRRCLAIAKKQEGRC